MPAKNINSTGNVTRDDKNISYLSLSIPISDSSSDLNKIA